MARATGGQPAFALIERGIPSFDAPDFCRGGPAVKARRGGRGARRRTEFSLRKLKQAYDFK